MTRNKRRKRVRNGFTMVELMAMLIIIGLLATVVVTKVSSQIDKARKITTQANLKILHAAVNLFRTDTGHYPSEDMGLLDLVVQPADIPEGRWQTGGYLETTDLPIDGWGNEFVFQLYPESGKQFVIISFGSDGEEGTEDDLYSTDAS